MAALQPARAAYNFDVASADGGHLFTYQQARYGGAILFYGMVFMAAIMAIPAFLLSSFALWAGFTFLLPILVFVLANAQRRTLHFHVSARAYAVGNVSYDLSHISEIFVKTPDTGIQARHVIGRGPSLTGGTSTLMPERANVSLIPTSNFANMGVHYNRCNCVIGFMYGERYVILAKGITEVTATAMLRRIIELTIPAVNIGFRY